MGEDRLSILGVPVDMVDMQAATERLKGMLCEDGCSMIVTPNSEIVYNASSKDSELKGIIEEADLVIPDGVGLLYASRILGKPLAERVTGIDFLGEILKVLSFSGQSIYILGAVPGVAKRAAQRMQDVHPGLVIAGTRDGYFTPEDEEGIVAEVNASGADFLCVALGSPKQEKFIKRHRDALKVKAAIGVGGSLDVWAGEVRRAPEFFQKHGLEWLYRLIKQPSRVKRMAALPLFMIRVRRRKAYEQSK